MLLSEAWKLYETDKQLEGYAKTTMTQYELQSRLLIKALGDKDISDITLEDLKGYLLEIAQRLKPSSVNVRQHFIRSILNWAHAEGYIDKNVAYKLKQMKEADRIPKALSEENLEMLREGCKSARDHALIEIFFATGCRIGEIYILNRNAINWDKRTVVVFGKGSKERECYFTIRAAIWLKKYLASRKDMDMALFVSDRNPHGRLSIAQIRSVIKKIAQKAGITDNVYPHKLRHTYATHLLNKGAPLDVVSEFMGHARIETTRIYCQLSGERRRELYQRYM